MTGSLQSRRGKYYTLLNIYKDGKRTQKSIPLGISDKPGNKTKAEKAHRETLCEWEKKLELEESAEPVNSEERK